MTELTAEIRRAAPAKRGVELPRGSRSVLIAEAPLEADEVAANVKVLPGWACATIIVGLACAMWAVIFMIVAAVF